MRFYQHALQQYRFHSNLPNGKGVSHIRSTLEDLNTQRMLFDSRQAAIFSEMDELPPLDALPKIRSPFPVLYLEFTEPIKIGESEPKYTHSHPNDGTFTSPVSDYAEDNDFVRAILFHANVAGFSTDKRNVTLSRVTFLLTSGDDHYFVDRTFSMDISKGQGYIQPRMAVSSPDPSHFPKEYLIGGSQNQFLPSGLKMVGGLGRHIGWWERITQQYAEFMSWVLMYMMAKGISIVEQRLSKKERKQLQSKKAPVQPWHVIVVEPQIGQANSLGMQEGSKHSYRYDVMGHLRFGNHHIKDSEGNWTRRRTVEWVTPHQRGVNHSRYVPAVRQYKRGKETHPVFVEYMKGGE